MHPIQRYLKALTEDALTSSKHKDIIEKCLDLGPAHWCLLSTHALPISLILGDLMYHVHWIPIDRDFDPDEMLIEFCNKHGSQIHINSHIGQMYRHESGKDKLDLFRSIRDRFDVGNAHFYRVFSKDIDLYHNICAKLQ